jgi:hypothetical protein
MNGVKHLKISILVRQKLNKFYNSKQYVMDYVILNYQDNFGMNAEGDNFAFLSLNLKNKNLSTINVIIHKVGSLKI